MSHSPPRMVWISWCDACGSPDYAYAEKPDKAGADCPRCETGDKYMKIAGPFALVEEVVSAVGGAARDPVSEQMHVDLGRVKQTLRAVQERLAAEPSLRIGDYLDPKSTRKRARPSPSSEKQRGDKT